MGFELHEETTGFEPTTLCSLGEHSTNSRECVCVCVGGGALRGRRGFCRLMTLCVGKKLVGPSI